MAQEMLKKLVSNLGGSLEIISAGVASLSNLEATENTKRVLLKEGIDASNHRSTAVTAGLIKKVDLILVMERFHKERILEIVPRAESKVHLLREFGKTSEEIEESEIFDPMGRPLEVYERVFEVIKDSLVNVAKWLKDTGWVK